MYLTCSTGIWGAATVFLCARQLGHSVAVAEKHYLGTHRGVLREARSLEAAMGIDVGRGAESTLHYSHQQGQLMYQSSTKISRISSRETPNLVKNGSTLVVA